MKQYYVQYNIGKAKYVLNFHNGQSTHQDGSPFYDCRIFRNKKELNQAINQLITDGYKERTLSL